MGKNLDSFSPHTYTKYSDFGTIGDTKPMVMAPAKDEFMILRQRLEILEHEVLALKEAQQKQQEQNIPVETIQPTIDLHSPASNDYAWFVSDSKRIKKMSLRDAKRVLVHDGLRALTTAAHEMKERLLFVAFADTQTAFKDGAIRTRSLVTEQNVPLVATLGSACGNPTRARMLQYIYEQEECTKTELSTASGAVGGNLYQHLNELHRAHLLTQPRRGIYRLTPQGRNIVEVLFWSAIQTRNQQIFTHEQNDDWSIAEHDDWSGNDNDNDEWSSIRHSSWSITEEED
jgi:DNA-binding transcriptional ArsR family regulator